MTKIHRNIESDYFKLNVLKDNANQSTTVFDSEKIKQNNDLQCSILLDYSFAISHKYTEPFSDLRGLINPMMAYILQNNLNFSPDTQELGKSDNVVTKAVSSSVKFANTISKWATATITGEKVDDNDFVANPYSWYFPYMWTGTNYPQFSVNIKIESLKSYKDLKDIVDRLNSYLKIKRQGTLFPNYKVYFGNAHSSWIKANGNSNYSGVVCRLLKYTIKGDKVNVIDNYPMVLDIKLDFEVSMPYYDN